MIGWDGWLLIAIFFYITFGLGATLEAISVAWKARKGA